MSQENVEIVRRAFAALAGEGVERDEVEGRLTDAALKDFFDPDVEWVPARQSPLASNRYDGYDGVRRFWAEVLSAWDEYWVEPQEFLDAGDQVVVIMRMRGRTHEVEIDEVWSGLWTLCNGRAVRVQGFASHDGALNAARLSQ
jgi:ketosteroid isomerase-like protein